MSKGLSIAAVLLILLAIVLIVVFYIILYKRQGDIENEIQSGYSGLPGNVPIQTLRGRNGTLQECYFINTPVLSETSAQAVCEQYGGRLATYDQLQDAANAGGQWTGIGWVVGSYIQNSYLTNTFWPLQSHDSTNSGVPNGIVWTRTGVNPSTSNVGVVCFGIKPAIGTPNILPFSTLWYSNGVGTPTVQISYWSQFDNKSSIKVLPPS
jgi:hypothetical protein